MSDDLTRHDVSVLLELTMVDLRKPEISPILRGRVVNNYLKSSGQTLSQAGRFLGIPKTTLHTWLMYNKIGEDKYAELVSSGLSKTQIHNIVKTPDRLHSIEKLNPYEFELEQMLKQARNIRYQCKQDDITLKMQGIIKDIVNELNRALIKFKD
jgi:hypothetical protein